MTVTVVHGQNHKGSSYHLARLQKADMGSSPTKKAYWERQGWLGKSRPWKQNG